MQHNKFLCLLHMFFKCLQISRSLYFSVLHAKKNNLKDGNNFLLLLLLSQHQLLPTLEAICEDKGQLLIRIWGMRQSASNPEVDLLSIVFIAKNYDIFLKTSSTEKINPLCQNGYTTDIAKVSSKLFSIDSSVCVVLIFLQNYTLLIFFIANFVTIDKLMCSFFNKSK